jgi:FkbM family methyltransferase
MLCRALELVGRDPGVRLARWLASVVMRLRRRHSTGRLRMVLRKPDPAPDLWKVSEGWLTEPPPDSAARLRAAAAENGLAVEVVEAALGIEEGEVALFADPRYDVGDAGVRSLLGTGDRVASARATTLDACGLDRLDMLKVDVEGAEAAVLEGARHPHEPAPPRGDRRVERARRCGTSCRSAATSQPGRSSTARTSSGGPNGGQGKAAVRARLERSKSVGA